MIDATANIILDCRRERKDGTYPSKLRIVHQRKYKDYATGLALTKEDFAKVTGAKPRGEFKEQRLFFNAIEERAAKIIKGLHPFSYEAFERDYLEKRDKAQSVYDYFDRYIAELTEQNRAGTASSYQCAVTSLKNYHRKTLRFADLTPSFLTAYENWMLSAGRSATTTGIYLRSLRAVCNVAIEEGALKRENYPFGKRRYTIPAGRNHKRALALSDVKKLFSYSPANDSEGRALALWKFSYLCQGVNMKDICKLRYKNVDGNRLEFIRAKTERSTKGNKKSIIVLLTPEAEQIVREYGAYPAHPERLVFGLIDDGLEADAERLAIKQATKVTNTHLKRIGEKLGFEIPLTSYVARHSFATILKRSGAPIEYISESLGHSDTKTTQNYLDSFEDDTRRKYAAALTNFE